MSMQSIIRDGHIHTPFCPHGTSDSLEQYIEEAIRCGLKEISFTEHMPLPQGVVSERLTRECALLIEEVMPYLRALEEVQEKYKAKIKINRGFEVDYIEGYEAKTREQLDAYGQYIEDSILSVHFVKVEETYYAVDLLEDFEQLELRLGSRKEVYDVYFNTLLKAIRADLGVFKPKRIGHPTLIRIFNQKHPLDYENKALIEEVVKALKEQGYEIDFNAAGLRRPFCKETYPSGYFLELVKKYKVEMVYGSDAHEAKYVGK